jgi:transcriptional regulator with XRE-family HTH domain
MNVAALRERRMWTQVRLAEEAGISPTTVSGIENGRISRPRFGTLRKLAVASGVEVAANSGFVEASISAHRDNLAEQSPERRQP